MTQSNRNRDGRNSSRRISSRSEPYTPRRVSSSPGRYASRRSHRRRRRPNPRFWLLAAAVLILLLVFLVRLQNGTDSPGPTGSTSPAPSSPVDDTPSLSPTPSEPTKETEIPWNLTLVNATHPLADDFTLETTTLSNGLTYDSRAYGALMDLLDACKAEGLEPIVCSAYRSVERQTELFQNKIDSYMADGLSYDEAYTATAVEIAIPGTSEHSLGLAADICALSYQILDDSQADTAEQQWLMAHCAEYGFILRYPKEKEDITGIIYEPWHYRYVGVEAAQEIMEQGLCLEEYLALYYEID